MYNTTKYNGVNMQLSPNATSYGDEGPMVYYYLDVPANTTVNANMSFTTGGYGIVYYRANGFPEYSYYDIEDSVSSGEYGYFDISWQNLYLGGRFYFGLQNRDDEYSWLNYTLGLGVSIPTTSTVGSGTTGSGTTGSGTTGSTTNTATTTTSTGVIVTGSNTSGNDTDTTSGMSTTSSPDTTTSAASIVEASFVLLVLALAAF